LKIGHAERSRSIGGDYNHPSTPLRVTNTFNDL
jgi:hypothetical protein